MEKNNTLKQGIRQQLQLWKSQKPTPYSEIKNQRSTITTDIRKYKLKLICKPKFISDRTKDNVMQFEYPRQKFDPIFFTFIFQQCRAS